MVFHKSDASFKIRYPIKSSFLFAFDGVLYLLFYL